MVNTLTADNKELRALTKQNKELTLELSRWKKLLEKKERLGFKDKSRGTFHTSDSEEHEKEVPNLNFSGK